MFTKIINKYSRLPVWPALLSALVAPGVGQIVNRDFKRGILLLTISLGGLIWFSDLVTEQLAKYLQGTPDMWSQNPSALNDALRKVVDQNPSVFFTFSILMILTWIFGVVDAYLSSRLIWKRRIIVHDENSDSHS